MAMATRLLLRLRTFRRPLPPTHASGSISSSGQANLAGSFLYRSPPGVRRHLHAFLPRGVGHNSRWFGGHAHSSSKPPPRRRILADVFCAASFSAAGLLIDNTSHGDRKSPPTGPPDHGSNNKKRDSQKSPPTGPLDHGSNKEKKVQKRDCTNVLLTVNLLVHVLDVASQKKLTLWGRSLNKLVRQGQVWRLLTPCVLHVGYGHLAANNFALDDIGPMVEEATGPGRFLTIYFTSALSGSLLSYFVCAGPSVGASSAICGLIGAQAVYMWRHREHIEKANETLWKIAADVLLNAGLGYVSRHRINNWGHLGGLIGGAGIEWFVGPYWGKQGVTEDAMKVIQDKAPLVRLIPGTGRPQMPTFY